MSKQVGLLNFRKSKFNDFSKIDSHKQGAHQVKAVKRPIPVKAEKVTEDKDIETPDGTLHATKGNYIIHGVNGEIYPIRADIFKKTYDIVGD